MKSRRKIWSLPLVLVTALLLVGLVGAAVLAQASNAAPRVANAVDDFELLVGATQGTDGGEKAINLADATQTDNAPVFTDTMPDPNTAGQTIRDPLAFTVLTSDPAKAEVELSAGIGGADADYSTAAATDGGVVSNWWNGLTSAQRQAVIGLTDDELDAPGNVDDDDCENTDWCREFDHDDDPDTEDIDGVGPYDDGADDISSDAKIIVTQAFHWNMLSGDEMVAAARAGGLDGASTYGRLFADLIVEEDDQDASTTELNQRAEVQSLYADGILRRGEGATLTVTAGDGTDADSDGRADNVGEATVTVKASDSTGRLIPPGDGSKTVGDEFDVDIIYNPLGDIGAVTLTAVDTTVRVDGLDSDGAVTATADDIVSIRITISDSAEGKIAEVAAAVTRAASDQLINYSLKDGSGLPYGIDGGNGTEPAADIVIKSGATAIDASFTVVVNEEGVSANRSTMPVAVVVAEGNTGPSFDDSALDALTGDVTLREHMGDGEADDLITAGLPIDFGANADDDNNQVLSYELSPTGKGLVIDEDSGVVKADAATLVDYDDEDIDNNTVEITVTVSDGTLDDTYKFDLTVTTNKPVADVSRDDVELVEGITDDEDDENDEDRYVATVSADEVRIDQRGVVLADIADYVTQSADTSSLTYTMLVATAPLRIETDSSEVIMDYVPDPGDDDILEYSLMISIDDGYDTQEDDDGDDIPDLVLHVNITVTVEPLPDQAFPVAEVDIDENEIGVVLPADDEALVGLIGDDAVEVTHAGGTGAGATGGGNFSVDGATGEVELLMPQDYEVDGGNHTVTLRVERTRDSILLGTVTVLITVIDVNEMPEFDATDGYARAVDENAQTGSEIGAPVSATDEDGGSNGVITFSISNGVPFSIATTANADGSYSGQIAVDGSIDIDNSPYTATVVATDGGGMTASQDVTVTLGDINDAPVFDTPVTLHMTIDENAPAGTLVATYGATDPDGGDIIQGVEFILRNADDVANFSIENVTEAGEITGKLTVAEGANLEYDIAQDSPAPVTYTVEVNVCDESDTGRACNEIALIVTLSNSNDEKPIIGNDDNSQGHS